MNKLKKAEIKKLWDKFKKEPTLENFKNIIIDVDYNGEMEGEDEFNRE